jgi:hypothetical protein
MAHVGDWRPVVGYEDAYEVSAEGDIRSFKTVMDNQRRRRPRSKGVAA